jgi:hypothetical protein
MSEVISQRRYQEDVMSQSTKMWTMGFTLAALLFAWVSRPAMAAVAISPFSTAGSDPAVMTTYAPVSSTDLIDSSQPTFVSQTITGYPDPNPGHLGTPAMLNDGTIGVGAPDYNAFGGTFLDDDDDGDSIWSTTFNLNTSINTRGYNITSIDTYSAYAPSRAAQQYDVYFTTVDSATPQFLLHVGLSPVAILGNAYAATLVHSDDTTGVLASNVNSIRFDVQKPDGDFSGSTYRVFDVFGAAAPLPEPGALAIIGLGGLLLSRRRHAACRYER